MRFTFIAACRFSLCPACRFGLTASSRAQPFGRESSNSTGGTSTRVEASFTGARRSLHFDIWVNSLCHCLVAFDFAWLSFAISAKSREAAAGTPRFKRLRSQLTGTWVC
jgi:hypothetical protein